MKRLERKLLITRMEQKILTAISENGKITELRLDNPEQESILGNIYIGKVKKIVKNIRAAFIEIMPECACYYSIEDNKAPVFTNKMNSRNLVAGDELLVQVSRESNKTKPPTVAGDLNFTGKYVVLTTGKCRIGVSGKLNPEEKKYFRELMTPYQNESYGFIVRTNAREAEKSEIISETEYLIRQYQDVIQKSKFRTCFSLLSRQVSAYISALRDTYADGLSRIITDDAILYGQIEEYLSTHQLNDLDKLSLYEDPLLPMAKLYRLEHVLKDALKERVWLKSGAYLVIQPTEALTVIDVNTGKYEGRKRQQDTFLKINLEAAREIAYQLRLRNISGIIVVDFINMESVEYKDTLLMELDDHLRKDPLKTTLIGMTPLNLVEITRKNVRKPLREQMWL